MKTTGILLSISLATMFACGGDDGGDAADGAALGTQEAASACDTLCTRSVECGWESVLSSCNADCTAAARWVRGDLLLDMRDCMETVECTTNNPCDDLFDEAQPLPYHVAYQTACTAKHDECNWGEELACGGGDFNVLASEVIDALTDCLGDPCDQSASCIYEVFARFGVD